MSTTHEKSLKKLEIYMTGGFVVPVADSFEEIMAILDGRAVAPEEYIVLHLQEGGRTACRKRTLLESLNMKIKKARRKSLTCYFYAQNPPSWYPRRKRGRHHRPRPG